MLHEVGFEKLLLMALGFLRLLLLVHLLLGLLLPFRFWIFIAHDRGGSKFPPGCGRGDGGNRQRGNRSIPSEYRPESVAPPPEIDGCVEGMEVRLPPYLTLRPFARSSCQNASLTPWSHGRSGGGIGIPLRT